MDVLLECVADPRRIYFQWAIASMFLVDKRLASKKNSICKDCERASSCAHTKIVVLKIKRFSCQILTSLGLQRAIYVHGL